MIRRQPQVTIAKLEGLARGGGAEFVAAMDMSFAAIGRAGLAQCEALMGIIPGGGATQYLSQRMTRGRVLEVILGAELVDAQLAERYGWVNRALPANELDAFVNRLANNIAALSEGVIEKKKKSSFDRESERRVTT
jgi:enoyl-CoA hydratase/carnithine racemase